MQDYRTLDPEQFYLNDCVIAGVECVLIHPRQLEATWTQENLCYRSAIVRKDTGAFISCGWPKFFNNGEKPDLYPDPNLFRDWVIEDKLDGSLVIISRFQGELIVRTRGTVSAFTHESGPELRALLDANPLIINSHLLVAEDLSLLFEYTSPNLRIVLAYPKPELTLIGAVAHYNQSLFPYSFLNTMARGLGVPRPRVFRFNSLDEIVIACQELKGREGYVLSYNDGANRVKIKALDYLRLHRLKSELGSPSKVLDLYMAHLEGEPAREAAGLHGQTLHDYIAKTFDFEIAEQVKPFIAQIEAAHMAMTGVIDEVWYEMRLLDGLSRKDAALSIIARYREVGLSGLAFILLDKRPVPSKTLRDLIERQLEVTTT